MFYNHTKEIVEKNIEYLRGAFSNVKSVDQVANEVLTNEGIIISEDRNRPLPSLPSLFDLVTRRKMTQGP